MSVTSPRRSDYWWVPFSETGRIRFRRVRFQTPNSVSFLGLTEFRGANSVSSSRPIICVPKRTHRVFRGTHRVCRRTQWGSVSSLLRNSTLETVFRPFPTFPPKHIQPKSLHRSTLEEFMSGNYPRHQSGSVRVRFRVRFPAVKVPMFGGFPVENPTNKATAPKLF